MLHFATFSTQSQHDLHVKRTALGIFVACFTTLTPPGLRLPNIFTIFIVDGHPLAQHRDCLNRAVIDCPWCGL
jgi:hypothetical protein